MKKIFLNETEANFLSVMLQRYFDQFCQIDQGTASKILYKLTLEL